jgi:hypothetical protein
MFLENIYFVAAGSCEIWQLLIVTSTLSNLISVIISTPLLSIHLTVITTEYLLCFKQ